LEFLAKLYGLECKCEDSSIRLSINEDDRWNDYWRRVKNYIESDIPVYTGVNCLTWPLYMDVWDIKKKVNLIRCGHAIVLVGYDEQKKKVYFNDPYDCRLTNIEKQKNCIYSSVSLDIFKKAVKKSYFPLKKYDFHTVVFEKISEPLSKEEQFNMVQRRNIERMKGNSSFYDVETCQKIYRFFGIEALMQYREDIKKMDDNWKNIFYKFLAFFRYPSAPFEDMFVLSEEQYYLRSDIANYLYNHREDFKNNRKTAIKLQTEAKMWKIHANIWTKLNTFIKTNKIRNVVNDVPCILNELIESIDDIIYLEEDIVNVS